MLQEPGLAHAVSTGLLVGGPMSPALRAALGAALVSAGDGRAAAAGPRLPVLPTAAGWTVGQGRTPVRVWEQAIDVVRPVLRGLRGLTDPGRRVVLLSGVAAGGDLGVSDEDLLDWCGELDPGASGTDGRNADTWGTDTRGTDTRGTDTWETQDSTYAQRQGLAAWARELVGPQEDLGRALRAAELLVLRSRPAADVTVLRVEELIGRAEGPLGTGVLASAVRRLRAGLPPNPPIGRRFFVGVEDLAQVVAGLLAGEVTAPGPVLIAGTVRWSGEDLRRLLTAGSADLAHHGETAGFRGLLPEGRPSAQEQLKALLAGAPPNGAAVLGASEPDGAVVLGASEPRAEELRIEPAVQVVVPPRPEQPDLVSARIAGALASGVLKCGGPWSARLAAALADRLELTGEHVLLLTASGSVALRLAAVALAGIARPGRDVAVLPSYTFAATGEILAQLGYRLRFYDVDLDTWTGDPASAAAALAPGDAGLLVSVDALGNPADISALTRVARAAGVPVLADSAPSLGARRAGHPVGAQADAHIFSMSFAKVISAGGAGGALVLPAGLLPRVSGALDGVDWTRSALMPEVAAIAALDQLERLETLHARRSALAEVYVEFLTGLDGVHPQKIRPGDRHALVHWGARFERRPQVERRLGELGVGTRNYYGPVLHRVGWADGLTRAGPALPVTDRLSEQVLALPMSSELTVDVAERVALAVRHAVLR